MHGLLLGFWVSILYAHLLAPQVLHIELQLLALQYVAVGAAALHVHKRWCCWVLMVRRSEICESVGGGCCEAQSRAASSVRRTACEAKVHYQALLGKAVASPGL